MQKILIIEDDEKLRKQMEIFFHHNGYQTECLKEFDYIIPEILNRKPDLVLLDLYLPNADGKYICKEIRKQSNVPIMIITSSESEIDELISINYGADQYITKPFNIQILLAKTNALLRRSKYQKVQETIDAKDFIINLLNSTIRKDKKEIELTKNELKILKYLTEKRNQIVSREEIMEYLWDSESFIDDNTLTVNITRLRNKLEELNLKELLETKRGQGYILK